MSGDPTCDCWLANHDHRKFWCRRAPTTTTRGGNWLGQHDVPVCASCAAAIRSSRTVQRYVP